MKLLESAELGNRADQHSYMDKRYFSGAVTLMAKHNNVDLPLKGALFKKKLEKAEGAIY